MLVVAEHRELDHRIKATYMNLANANVAQRDRYLFRLPLNRLLLKDFIYKKTWLQQVQQATSSSRYRAWARSLSGMRHGMQRWLRTAQS